MTNHRITVTGRVTYKNRSSDTEGLVVLNSRYLTPASDGSFREETGEYYCFLGEPLLKHLTRFEVEAHVLVTGQLISHPDYGNPEPDEDGSVTFKIEASDLLVLAPKASAEREDLGLVYGIGNLGKDPETDETESGVSFTNVSIAADRTTKDGEQFVKLPTWFKLTSWRKRGLALAKNFKKGNPIFFEVWRLSLDPETGGPRTWERRDGTVGASYEGNIYNWGFVAKAKTGAKPAGEEPPASSSRNNDDDQIPF